MRFVVEKVFFLELQLSLRSTNKVEPTIYCLQRQEINSFSHLLQDLKNILKLMWEKNLRARNRRFYFCINFLVTRLRFREKSLKFQNIFNCQNFFVGMAEILNCNRQIRLSRFTFSSADSQDYFIFNIYVWIIHQWNNLWSMFERKEFFRISGINRQPGRSLEICFRRFEYDSRLKLIIPWIPRSSDDSLK